MYISNISLRNIRGFEQLDFDLTRPDTSFAGWTVFTGDNGSGKSTLLKAIALCLTGRDTARALQPNLNGWIRYGAAGADASIQLQIVRAEDDDRKPGRPGPKKFPAQLLLKNGGKDTTLQPPEPPLKGPKNQPLDRTIWSSSATGWFSCGYGPFRRAFGSSSEATQIMVSPSTARFATMFQETASLVEGDRWLRDLKYKELENRQAEREQLAALLELLNDDLMPNQFRIARVDSEGLWLADRNGTELTWSDMSDGYRSTLALLIDIYRHLGNAYPHTQLTARNKDGLLQVIPSGVVLIDEIDAHLHPEWQREIGFWLKRRFPNIQFLVTTHSPIICQAADPNGLFVLPEPGSEQEPHALSAEDYQRVIASRPDTILLTPAFGLQNTRSPQAVEARSAYADLQAKKRALGTLTNAEQQRIEQLSLFVTDDEEL